MTTKREEALRLAAELYAQNFTGGFNATNELLATASGIFNWLTQAPVVFLITFGPVRDQTTQKVTGTITGGISVQLRDNQQVDLTVSVTDAKGIALPDDSSTTADDISWSIDSGDLATLNVSADTRTCTVVAGSTIGSGVITVSLGDLSATLALDVIPGDAAMLTIAEGQPVPQPV